MSSSSAPPAPRSEVSTVRLPLCRRTISVPSPSRKRLSARASNRGGCPKSSWARSSPQRQTPARQASIAAGIPVESPAWGVNQLCGSGLRSVALGYQALLNGDSEIVVAGGQESMSMAPHAQYLRGGVKMGPVELVDTMIKDGLWDAFNGYHMGNTAENVAKQYQITRAHQDEFAVALQNKAEAAQKAGKFKDEIVPLTIKGRKGDVVVDSDEYPRHGATIEAMGKLRPAFEKDGTVTAGSASGINDGAAAVVL